MIYSVAEVASGVMDPGLGQVSEVDAWCRLTIITEELLNAACR